MDRLVKSVTLNANPRPCANKERRRSRGNRKSCKSHLCPHPLPLYSVPARMLFPHLCVPVSLPYPISVSLSHLCVPVLMPCPTSVACSHIPVPSPCLSSHALPSLCPHTLSLYSVLCPCPDAFSHLCVPVPPPYLCPHASSHLCALVPMPCLAPSPLATPHLPC